MKIAMPFHRLGRIVVVSLTAAGMLLSGSVAALADRDGRYERHEDRYEKRHEGRGEGRGEKRLERRNERERDGRHGSRFERGNDRHRHVTVIRELPSGHRTVVIDKTRYYVHQDRYYTRGHGGYVAIRPPVGAFFATLPLGSVRVSIGNNFFFRSADVYYRPAPRGYVVVAPPVPVSAFYPANVVVVGTAVLNVRSGPGTEFRVVARAWEGDILTLNRLAGGWCQVQLPNGTFGWVMHRYTRPLAAG